MIRDGKMRFHADLEPLMVEIDTVAQAPYNYNNGDVEAVQQSIEANGMYRPIFVQRGTDLIIAGNHTWQACKQLGASRIPVIYLDVDDVEAKKIMVADNRTAALAQPDNGLLMALLQEIDEGATLYGTGYTPDDLEILQHLNEIPLDTQEFATWPTFSVQLPPNVLRGFMWVTREADTDRERFELLLRMAGWDGSDSRESQ
jgi:hypothetical protein